MSTSKTGESFYPYLQKEVKAVNQLLNTLEKSNFILEYFDKYLVYLVYSYLITAFFNSLRRDILRKLDLPSNRIKNIKLHYDKIHKQIASTEKLQSLENIRQINEESYINFKEDIKNNFPEFIKLVDLIEKENQYSKLTSTLFKERNYLTGFDNKNTTIISVLATKKLEFVLKKGKFSLNKTEEKQFDNTFKDIFEHSIVNGVNVLHRTAKKTLEEHEDIERIFNDRLYKKWKKPLDLLRLHIISSSEIGKEKIEKFGKKYRNRRITNVKEKSLIHINARCIQIAYEIFTLIKNGYADGANARWRTLFELMVIFVVIANNHDEFAKRYLEHQNVKKYKQSLLLKDYHKRLGESFSNVNHAKLQTEYTRLIGLYGKNFAKDYGWIPNTYLTDCNFKSLVKKISIDHYLPYYDESHNQVHGGSKGFYRMGLIHQQQKNVILAGPTDYGLADPIQNTVYCLNVINATYLKSTDDFKDLIDLKMMYEFTKDIGKDAVKIQKELKHVILENIKNSKSNV